MTQTIEPPIALLTIPTVTPSQAINLVVGRPLFVLGRNGVGKSALVHHLRGQLGPRVVYMPGARPSYFEGEGLSLTTLSRNQLVTNLYSWDSSPDTRWRSISGSSRNEKAIHDLQVAELQYKIDAAEQIKREGVTSSAIARLQANISPLDRINVILAQAGVPVQVSMQNNELKAESSGVFYSIAKMSDGERSALIFAAEIISAAPSAVFVVDEPELHLHRAIVVPLLKSFIAERPDCGFVISTHELDLPSAAPDSEIVLVRSCQWQGNIPVKWDVDLIEDSESIPESLRVDVLGARRKILFVEGNSTSSLDQPLYSLLFPDASVRCRETCVEVMRAVDGLRAVQSLHRVVAFGLIDHDGMSDQAVNAFEVRGIYPLPIFSVESIIYSEEVLNALALHQSITFGLTSVQIMGNVVEDALKAIEASGQIEHLAARLSERKIRDKVISTLPNRDAIRAANGRPMTILIDSSYPLEISRLTRLLVEKNVSEIISSYPVRETGMLSAIVKALKFNSRADYESAALNLISRNDLLRTSLRNKLGRLTEALLADV